ncbi:MAG: hypothetical protein M3176_12885 [Chloroflexota bacterium]|nr:hypothetical protein [Chloroflexota bacterium]MDQ6907715.1 hypothetical protein [Chloroflexota bacterium]
MSPILPPGALRLAGSSLGSIGYFSLTVLPLLNTFPHYHASNRCRNASPEPMTNDRIQSENV